MGTFTYGKPTSVDLHFRVYLYILWSTWVYKRHIWT